MLLFNLPSVISCIEVNFVEQILTSETCKNFNIGSKEEFGLVLFVLFFTGFELTKMCQGNN